MWHAHLLTEECNLTASFSFISRKLHNCELSLCGKPYFINITSIAKCYRSSSTFWSRLLSFLTFFFLCNVIRPFGRIYIRKHPRYYAVTWCVLKPAICTETHKGNVLSCLGNEFRSHWIYLSTSEQTHYSFDIVWLRHPIWSLFID
jgi:hypothetical protein